MPETTIISTSDTSNAAKPVSYDVNHPYHLNNSDSPGMTLVNIVFDGRGYPGWRRSILLSLSAKKKLDNVIYSKTAKRTLGQFGAEIWEIKWSQALSSAEGINRKAKLTNSLEDQRLIQFLMGLNDIYAQARGNILMMNPLPSIDVAYSLLLHDENQREVYANTHFNSESKLRSQTQRGAGISPKYNNSGKKFVKLQQRFKGKKKYNPNVSCTYCGKTGHIQEDYYRIIGFPEDFEFTNHKGYQTQIKGNAVLAHEERENLAGQSTELNKSNFGQQLIKEQIEEMMHMYKQTKLAHAGNTGINANAVVGTILKFSGSVFTSLKSDTWIIDSGASEHMCFDPNSFLFLTPLPVPLNISLPNFFKGLLMKSPQVLGEVREGLYLLEPSSLKSKGLFSSNVLSIPKERNHVSESISFSSAVQVNGIPDVKLWQFNVKVRMIRSDNALELGKGTQEAAFLASEGILHQLSCVATPQQNGIV
ncbi:uncharacterized protein LOC142166147 [Nicotiana tabacum]|uniref:Uncharacterized protein LOC142166147 n=1 Tax=Nicotiana tabacum TaxID=4097 RepID=A0AC58S6Q4_TOBAC